MTSEYHLLGNEHIFKKDRKAGGFNSLKKRIILIEVLLVISIIGIFNIIYSSQDDDNNIILDNDQKYMNSIGIDDNQVIPVDDEYVLIKGNSRKDKYGMELNINIMEGIYSIGYNESAFSKIEDTNIYSPPCPYLRPVHYPDSILNPICEESSLQIVNYNDNNGKGYPYSLKLDSITNQINKWKEWKKNNTADFNYYFNKTTEELVQDKYYPFDYGDNIKFEDIKNNDEFYQKVIDSRMDEVPDPRRRRLFSFILFNGEFDLLDMYLAELYEIVDYFVIYESNSTFTGNPKPLYFTRTLLETDRYDRFKDKLIPFPRRIIVDENNGRGKAFPREHLARREVIEKGLRSVHARHGDIFMHGDLDEFPKAHILARLKKCGGWEHLQAGIGGGPKSFKVEDQFENYKNLNENENENIDKNKNNKNFNGTVESYFINDEKVSVNKNGEYQVNYFRVKSLGFLDYFYEYSLTTVQDKSIGTVAHPNLVIFDARQSLGQFNYYNHEELNNKNKNKKNKIKKVVRKKNKNDIKTKENKKLNKRMSINDFYDPLLDPNFDPYQGYTYSDNTNDRHRGKGFIGEYLRFETSKSNGLLKKTDKAVFWNGGWHLSSCLPTIEQFINKVTSYSHFKDYKFTSMADLKEDIISRINNHYYIFGSKRKYPSNEPILPESYIDGYNYNFNYNYWSSNTNTDSNSNSKSNEEFNHYIDVLKHEVPNQIWRNPICYSYMIDRNFGLKKKLWWQVIPKDEWKTFKFNTLNDTMIKDLLPNNLSDSFKNQMLEQLKEEN